MATAPTTLEAAQFLRDHPGHAFCDECLAERTGMAVRDVRRARVALAGMPEFDHETWLCSVCFAAKPVIHVAWLRFNDPHPNTSDPTDEDD